MIYQIENQAYEEVQQLLSGEMSDVVVLKKIPSVDIFYIAQIIKSHQLAKELLLIFKQDTIKYLTKQGQMCLLFPYEESRPILRFLERDQLTSVALRQLSVDLIIECMKSSLPYPVMFLILKQHLIQLHKDNQIRFLYSFDFSEFDSRIMEEDCVKECFDIICWLLQDKMEKPEFELIRKRMVRRGYARFTELLHDMKIIPTNRKKWNPVQWWKDWEDKSKLLRFLFILCLVLAGITLVLLVVRIIFGELPFLKIFFQDFRTIGTESMLQ